jgi:hypothetical protein
VRMLVNFRANLPRSRIAQTLCFTVKAEVVDDDNVLPLVWLVGLCAVGKRHGEGAEVGVIRTMIHTRSITTTLPAHIPRHAPPYQDSTHTMSAAENAAQGTVQRLVQPFK